MVVIGSDVRERAKFVWAGRSRCCEVVIGKKIGLIQMWCGDREGGGRQVRGSFANFLENLVVGCRQGSCIVSCAIHVLIKIIQKVFDLEILIVFVMFPPGCVIGDAAGPD